MDKDAEIERLRGDVARAKDALGLVKARIPAGSPHRLRDRLREAEAERDRLKATIARVKARCHEGRDGPYAMYTNVVKDDILDILNQPAPGPHVGAVDAYNDHHIVDLREDGCDHLRSLRYPDGPVSALFRPRRAHPPLDE